MPSTSSMPVGRDMTIAANPTDAAVPGNSVASKFSPTNPLVWTNDTPAIITISPALGAKLTCGVHAIGAAGQVGIIQLSGSADGGPVIQEQLEITLLPGPFARFNPTFTVLPPA